MFTGHLSEHKVVEPVPKFYDDHYLLNYLLVLPCFRDTNKNHDTKTLKACLYM